MDPLRLNVNLTTVFILPMLYDKDLKHSDILTDNYENTYIADLDEPVDDNKIIIRYDDDRQTFEMPDEYLDEYHKFILGDYSKLSNEYKQKVLNFWEANEDTLLYGVLYKEGETIVNFWKDNLDTNLEIIGAGTEYWKPPNIKEEIFGIGGE